MTDHLIRLEPDRRVVLRGMGAVSVALLSGTLLGGCESLLRQIANRPMRRRLRAGSPEVDADIATYRQAVSLMKGLPAGNPRSWAAQAAIHGTVAGGFNLCQHGTDHFFSWHRAYLVFFEQICRKLTGNDRFALPYWNWNQDPGIHTAFLTAGDPLFHPRTRTSMAGVSAVSTAALDPVLADGNFFTFSAGIEATPHNTVHVRVGQDMVTGGSPLDPIFWCHHCMVDYCWAKWNIELQNDNTNVPAWTGTSWNHFVDGEGNPVSITAGLTTILPLLSYQYESSAIGSSPAAASAAAAQDFDRLKARVEQGASVTLDVKRRYVLAAGADLPVNRPYSTPRRVAAAEMRSLITDQLAAEQFILRVSYVDYPKVNDFFIRVFVNLPGATAETPITDAHYAGSFAIFGVAAEGRPPHHAPSYLVNITRTVRELVSRGALSLDGELSIQLVAVPAHERLSSPETVLKLQGLELLVTPLLLRK